MFKSKKAIIISGATASGKSSLALKLAKDFNGEIINADSSQIYKDLPTLSAQPSFDEKKRIKHHLYGFLEKDEIFSVVNWLNELVKVVNLVYNNDKLPIIVGGSGMYISKLIDGISEIPNISQKNKLKARQDFEEYKLAGIIEKIKIPEIKDQQRALRAYEVLLETNKSIRYWQEMSKKKYLADFHFIHFNLFLERELLYKNCNERFEKMLNLGALEEVQRLLGVKNLLDLPIARTLGFKEIYDYLQKKISYQEMLELATKLTRNYAKRQLTWFRNQLKYNNDRHRRFDINSYNQLLDRLDSLKIID